MLNFYRSLVKVLGMTVNLERDYLREKVNSDSVPGVSENLLFGAKGK